jgi:flagellin
MGIAERMDSQTRGMNVAIRNANDAISMAQTAEGALGAIAGNLQRMRELAVQAANGTNATEDWASLNLEFQQLIKENIRVVDNTKFNDQLVLTGTGGTTGTFTFQIGANSTGTNQIDVDSKGTATGLGIAGANLNSIADALTDATTAKAAMDNIDLDIKDISTVRSTWGASQNRFESVISNLRVSAENSAASHGRIVDADYAQETASLTRAQVLQQAGVAMVAQANQAPNGVLALLR